MDKCIYCQGELIEEKIKYPVLSPSGVRHILEIDAWFCKEDQNYYVNSDTIEQIRSLKYSDDAAGFNSNEEAEAHEK